MSEDFPIDPIACVAGDALEEHGPHAPHVLDLLAAIPTTVTVERLVGVSDCPSYLHRVSCNGEAAAIRFMEGDPSYNRWPNCGFVGLVKQRMRGPVLANLLFVGPGLYPPDPPVATDGLDDLIRVFDIDAPHIGERLTS